MKTRKCVRYISECGRGFWNKKSCIEHENKCKCWTNPQMRTCKTCRHSRKIIDGNGMEGVYRQEWEINDCLNPEFDWDKMFNHAFDGCKDLCVNCEKWEKK